MNPKMEASSFFSAPPRAVWKRYAASVGIVLLGFLAREGLTPFFGPTALPFIFFFPAIAAAAWYGGFGPGLLALALATISADWFFFEPVHSFAIGSAYDEAAIAAFIVASIFIIGSMQAMHHAKAMALKDVAERNRVEAELAREKGSLATTLASIGDGVIVTDAEGRVTFMNPEAERLTGWNPPQAKGRPLTEVFRIVNETTRQIVENPVEKVLRLSTVVGLANHTVLLSKNGREIPIDDSAAPVRLQVPPRKQLWGWCWSFAMFRNSARPIRLKRIWFKTWRNVG